jgi:hypothetical protein
LQLNDITLGSTKSIADNITQWKKAAHSTPRGPERDALLLPPSSTTAKDVVSSPK